MKGRQKGMNPCGTQKETDTATSHSPLSPSLPLSPSSFSAGSLLSPGSSHCALPSLAFYKNHLPAPISLFVSHHPLVFFLFFHHHIHMTDKCVLILNQLNLRSHFFLVVFGAKLVSVLPENARFKRK